MKDKLTIIKVGGAVLNDNKIFKTFLNNFSKIEEKKILVHGGGIIASNYMVRLGIPPKFIKGRRITDEKTLDVAIMTYARTYLKPFFLDFFKFKIFLAHFIFMID
jgi:acetylglutamate kinase